MLNAHLLQKVFQVLIVKVSTVPKMLPAQCIINRFDLFVLSLRSHGSHGARHEMKVSDRGAMWFQYARVQSWHRIHSISMVTQWTQSKHKHFFSNT